MENSNYTKAYTEVLEILKHIPKKDLDKVPKEKLEFYKKHRDKEYDYRIDNLLEFKEQKLSDISKAILAILFRDYWANDYQKEKILIKEKYDRQKLEDEQRNRYNPNNVFKKNDESKTSPITNIALVEYKKENWYTKFIDYIRNIFKKK